MTEKMLEKAQLPLGRIFLVILLLIGPLAFYLAGASGRPLSGLEITLVVGLMLLSFIALACLVTDYRDSRERKLAAQSAPNA